MERVNLSLLSFEILQNEEWSYIPDIPKKYIVSTKGRVGTLVGGRFRLKSTYASRQQYLKTYLSDGCKQKPYSIHRLVALAFLPNPENLPQVNHKDENRQNNNIYNLEWCTAKYNLEYSGIIRKWSSAGTAASLKARGYNASKINNWGTHLSKYHKYKIYSYKRGYSHLPVYAFDLNHNCYVYDNFKDASCETGISEDEIILSSALNRKCDTLKYHTNNILFSIEDDFRIRDSNHMIDVAQYFKEQ